MKRWTWHAIFGVKKYHNSTRIRYVLFVNKKSTSTGYVRLFKATFEKFNVDKSFSGLIKFLTETREINRISESSERIQSHTIDFSNSARNSLFV